MSTLPVAVGMTKWRFPNLSSIAILINIDVNSIWIIQTTLSPLISAFELAAFKSQCLMSPLATTISSFVSNTPHLTRRGLKFLCSDGRFWQRQPRLCHYGHQRRLRVVFGQSADPVQQSPFYYRLSYYRLSYYHHSSTAYYYYLYG